MSKNTHEYNVAHGYIKQLRVKYKNGELSKEQIERLNNIGVNLEGRTSQRLRFLERFPGLFRNMLVEENEDLDFWHVSDHSSKEIFFLCSCGRHIKRRANDATNTIAAAEKRGVEFYQPTCRGCGEPHLGRDSSIPELFSFELMNDFCFGCWVDETTGYGYELLSILCQVKGFNPVRFLKEFSKNGSVNGSIYKNICPTEFNKYINSDFFNRVPEYSPEVFDSLIWC